MQGIRRPHEHDGRRFLSLILTLLTWTSEGFMTARPFIYFSLEDAGYLGHDHVCLHVDYSSKKYFQERKTKNLKLTNEASTGESYSERGLSSTSRMSAGTDVRLLHLCIVTHFKAKLNGLTITHLHLKLHNVTSKSCSWTCLSLPVKLQLNWFVMHSWTSCSSSLFWARSQFMIPNKTCSSLTCSTTGPDVYTTM